jgi:oligoendopeptidase F
MNSKYKVSWDLSHIYSSISDPNIEHDIQRAEIAYTRFAKKYANKTDYLENEEKLAKALKEYERLLDVSVAKPYIFLHFHHDLESKNSAVEAKLNTVAERARKIGNITLFFGIAISKIAKPLQKKYLNSKVLAPYRYFLQCAFRQGEHMLSEKEEKILSLQSLPAHTLWVQGGQKMLAARTVLWKGATISIPEAMGLLSQLPIKDRRALNVLCREQFKSIAEYAESEMNAVVTQKKIEDELRGFSTPYESTIVSYENEIETVENLVAVITKQYKIAHRFYKAKAKMLGLETLEYVDRLGVVGKTKREYAFETSAEIVKSAFSKVDSEYADIFESFLKHGQIDVFPKQGKRGGAYCWGTPGMPTFVLLNHTNSFSSVTTMAHEMGHALHSTFSYKSQAPLYREYTIATAEVASTLFENFVFEEILPTLSVKEQIVALHDKISDSIQTIFRQIACFNFERELHERIRKEGMLPKEAIAELMNKHMRAYLGPVFNLSEDDGYFFVYWSHIRNFFYVYSYAFGELVSSALYEMYQENPENREKIKQFLCAGGSDSPENIFASIGIDVRNPEFFQKGLKKIEKDIARLETLVFKV